MKLRGLTLSLAIFTSHVAVADSSAVTASYHIGNSLTVDSQPLALAAFAEQVGLSHQAGFHVRESSSLEEIIANPGEVTLGPVEEFGMFQNALTTHAWDWITIQPHPRRDDPETPEDEQSTLADDVAIVLDLIDLARTNPANAETDFFIYSGWPVFGKYETKWNLRSPNFDDSPTIHARQYYENLIERVRSETDADVFIIPVGEVLMELDRRFRETPVPYVASVLNLYRDLLHLRIDIGRYIASVTTFATLFNTDPGPLTRPQGFFASDERFSPEFYNIVHQAVREVVSQHPLTDVTLPAVTTADFDANGIVDDFDVSLWNSSYGVPAAADADNDAQIGGGDLIGWQRRVGRPNGAKEGCAADFDGDDFVDGDDLMFWIESLGVANGGDADGDSDTDGHDLLTWQRELTEFVSADFTLDHFVDGQDLQVWSDNVGIRRGDANLDSAVTGADLLVWQRELGLTSLQFVESHTVSVVPEPRSALFASAVGGIFCGRRGGRRRK